eukprot:349962-Pyramimonas_sp.AAC.1
MPSGSSGAPVGELHEPPPDGNAARDKAVVTSLRAAHSAWDRFKRDAEAALAASVQNDRTKGCLFETELRGKILVEGNCVDTAICLLEKKYLQKVPFDDNDLKTGAAKAQDIKDTIKKGGKRVSALQAWFKVED